MREELELFRTAELPLDELEEEDELLFTWPEEEPLREPFLTWLEEEEEEVEPLLVVVVPVLLGGLE